MPCPPQDSEDESRDSCQSRNGESNHLKYESRTISVMPVNQAAWPICQRRQQPISGERRSANQKDAKNKIPDLCAYLALRYWWRVHDA